jgi:hypothetical protein
LDSELDGEITHRIDLPHAANLLSHAQVMPSGPIRRPARLEIGVATSFSASNDFTHCLDTQLVGIAHAEDLLDYIQRLSEDLDARSAKLNADIAIQERRERAFRLWAQQRSEDLRKKREECEVERQQLKTQARRIALTGDDPQPDDWSTRGIGNR